MSIHDFGYPLDYSAKPEIDKKAWMEENEHCKAEFYASGKTHSVHKPEESAFNETLHDSGKWTAHPTRKQRVLESFYYDECLPSEHLSRSERLLASVPGGV